METGQRSTWVPKGVWLLACTAAAAVQAADLNSTAMQGGTNEVASSNLAPVTVGAPFQPNLPGMAQREAHFGQADGAHLTLRGSLALRDTGNNDGSRVESFFDWTVLAPSVGPGPQPLVNPFKVTIDGRLQAGAMAALAGQQGQALAVGQSYSAFAYTDLRVRVFDLDAIGYSPLVPDIEFRYQANLQVQPDAAADVTLVDRREGASWRDKAGVLTVWPGSFSSSNTLAHAVYTFEDLQLSQKEFTLGFSSVTGHRLHIVATLVAGVDGAGRGGVQFGGVADMSKTFDGELDSGLPGVVFQNNLPGKTPLPAVPEPGTLTSTLLGLALLAARRLRRPGRSRPGIAWPAAKRQRVAKRWGAVALALGGFSMAALAAPDGNHVALGGGPLNLSTFEPVAPAVLGTPFIPALPSMPANQGQYFGLSDAQFLTLRGQVALNASDGLEHGLTSFFQWQTQVQSSSPGTPVGTRVPIELNLALGGTLGAGTPGALTGGAGTPVPLNDRYDAVASARVEFKVFNLDTHASSTPDLAFTYLAWLNVNARNTGGRPGDLWIERIENAFWEDRAGHSTDWPGNHVTRTIQSEAISTFETMALAPGGYVLPFEASVGQRLRIEARLFVLVGGSGSGLPYAAFSDMSHTADGELRSSTPGVTFTNILPGVAPAVPEPASVLLLMAGLLALAPRSLRRRNVVQRTCLR